MSLASTAFDQTPQQNFFQSAPKEAHSSGGWSPYVNNGGTVIGVSGKDFAIVGGDTRISVGYSISTRTQTKLYRLTSKCVLATSGMLADTIALQKVLRHKLTMYVHQNGRELSTPGVAQLLANTLYSRRFFPFYTFNVLAGVDNEGNGVCYSYDAVGSFERVAYSSSGSGNELVQPLLDSQIGWKNQKREGLIPRDELTKENLVGLVKDAFTSAGERDIHTGDFVDICVITPEGIETLKFEL
eukprot:CAMPEP_0184337530 /NCGR_PEP_ID=MMETSP1089-20130417/5938_1 /TAXON_ID=38269 ORGANISM="Gloeochaete wittrockiana, Strain SAG46.84" /NCGR_SAMPLE_ID=MMETSP1089 /ASSEMBLY_ACC=CAM_ASM_000445 /LENGTH=241 /DNA_ID=CAMNT_0026663343 /DNA_START=115 /DNA_END=837 /DNA_ORIENTATION=-